MSDLLAQRTVVAKALLATVQRFGKVDVNVLVGPGDNEAQVAAKPFAIDRNVPLRAWAVDAAADRLED